MKFADLKKLDLGILVDPLPREPSVQQLYIEQRSDPAHQSRLVAMLRDGIHSRGGIWLRDNDYPYQRVSSIRYYSLPIRKLYHHLEPPKVGLWTIWESVIPK